MPPSRKAAEEHRQLTPKQMAILTYLRDYERKYGYAPTLQEVADHFSVTKVTVFEHVSVLQRKGFLQRLPHKARSLKLTSQAEFPDDRPTLIPLLGRIAAGAPVETLEDKDSLDLEEVLAGHGTTFALEVRGVSMIDEQIQDGDFVIAERRETARDGETVVALLENGETTLKKFYREKDRIRLQPANPDLSPIYARDVKIQGVVIGVFRRY
ncbi:MAG: transcriptional repressor LexA [Phycisphaerae bacterium]|nr:transcriptional repressor LexA [Phycisphaerae bacterium]